MTRPKTILILSLAFFLNIVPPGFAKNSPKAGVKEKIESIIRSLNLRRSTLGIRIVDLNTDKALYELNSQKHFNPASNIKVLTAYCALKELGPDFKWKTTILSGSFPDNGVIKGDIYAVGSGDPYMVSERVWLLSRELINRGIKVIKGDIVLDSSLFRPDKSVKGFSEHSERSFMAGKSAISLNFNSVTVRVNPGKPGGKPFVFIDPDLDYFLLDNDAVTVKDHREQSPKIDLTELKGRMKIRVYGKWSERSKRVHYRKVFHPELYFGYALKKFFEQNGGLVKGTVRTGMASGGMRELLTFDSMPLSSAVFGMNKFSNNFMADQIALTLGYQKYGKPADNYKGMKAINRCFKSLGVKKKGTVIKSASGLSRDSLITPHEITELLAAAYRDLSVFPELAASLPLFGSDGTVKRRENPEDGYASVRVKTGNINSVDNISGYIMTDSKRILAFSVTSGGFREGERGKYRDFQDKIIGYIFNNL
jgi:D-alanyl-D-alanine carboxypeptidase/D-alanyl-D-alanine-endopeptidase (penicillin-binding protein 4)